MMRNLLWIMAIFCLCGGAPAASETNPPASSLPEKEVIATVGDEAISAGELDRLLRRSFPNRKIDPGGLPWLQAQLLEEIIDRRLVLAYARQRGDWPPDEEVERELARQKARLAARQQSPADSLDDQSINESDLRRQVVWGLVWDKLVAGNATEGRMEAFFRSHHREFDGTELSVSHILLRPQQGSLPAAADDLLRRAADIRQAIVDGKISFAEAARKYSKGPSAKNDGELGYIRRHGAMDEAFSRAAFRLEVGQISEPVRTPFGVHLIRCNQTKPGAKQLADARREVADAMARELLEKLAHLERGRTVVEYTGKSAYFKPGTRELIGPRQP